MMENGILSRLIIAEILKKIRVSNLTFDQCFDEYIKKNKFSELDKKFINNIVLNSMRNFFTIDSIIKEYVKTINKNDISYFLIISAIYQIIFLDIKSYAVINSTCEAYKINKNDKMLKFINGLLRNIDRDKNKINLDSYNKLEYPSWFKKNIKELESKKRKSLYRSIKQEPKIHLIFKNKITFKKISYIKTSKNSLALNESSRVADLAGYKDGNWWIQDYGASIPIKLIKKPKNKNVLDMCAAPGGKTFQLLSLGSNVKSYDVSRKRIDMMNKNLKRLNYNLVPINENVLKIKEDLKYDIVLLDAPCSSIGTIKRNPEILYREKPPNFEFLLNLQNSLLNKAARLVNKKGILIYIVCSIFKIETTNQIKNFLKKNSNFEIDKILTDEEKNINKMITKEGFLQSYPFDLKKLGGVDGFFVARLVNKS